MPSWLTCCDFVHSKSVSTTPTEGKLDSVKCPVVGWSEVSTGSEVQLNLLGNDAFDVYLKKVSVLDLENVTSN